MAGVSRRCSAATLIRPQSSFSVQQGRPFLPEFCTLGLPHLVSFSTTRSHGKRYTRRDEADIRPPLPISIDSRLAVFEEEALANPFYRMLASPLRRCIITKQIMPKDLLISLKPVFLPPESTLEEESPQKGKGKPLEEAFVPDNILHPYFVPSKPGPSAYFCATKFFLRELRDHSQARRPSDRASPEPQRAKKSKGQDLLRFFSPTAYLPEQIEAMITHQLQTRVLQEVQLLLTRRGEDEEAGRTLLTQSGGKTPTSILDFSSSSSPCSPHLSRAGERAEVALPLHYHIPSLFEPERAVDLKEKLGSFLDVDIGDKVGLPQTAVLGPLAVALWRLRNWVVGNGRFFGGGEREESGE